MKTVSVAAIAVSAILGTAALAGPVEDLVAQLEAEGYSNITVETSGDKTEVEAMLGDTEREIKLDASGTILSDMTEKVDEDDADEADDESDDDDDDEDDQDDNDEDEDEDEDESEDDNA